MDENTVTITLSKGDADRLFNCLTHMATWAQGRHEQALQRLEDNPRDEGYGERRRGIRGEIDATAALAHDAGRLKDIVWRATQRPDAP